MPNTEICDNLGGGGEVQQGGHTPIPMADSRCSTAEAHTILLSDYHPIRF